MLGGAQRNLGLPVPDFLTQHVNDDLAGRKPAPNDYVLMVATDRRHGDGNWKRRHCRPVSALGAVPCRFTMRQPA